MEEEEETTMVVSSSETSGSSSTSTAHEWGKKSFKTFSWCSFCGEFLWGLRLQGWSCSRCGLVVHHKCRNRVGPCNGVAPFPRDRPAVPQETSTPLPVPSAVPAPAPAPSHAPVPLPPAPVQAAAAVSTPPIATAVTASAPESAMGVPVMVPSQPGIPISPETGLPNNWEVRVDPRTRRFYYVDHAKRTTHWEPPRELLLGIPLPAGWEARLDQRTGRIYFIDHTTRSTHWRYPGPPTLGGAALQSPSAPPVQQQQQEPVPTAEALGIAEADPRVAELVAMGFERRASLEVVAISAPTAQVADLVDAVLQRSKLQQQQQSDQQLPSAASADPSQQVPSYASSQAKQVQGAVPASGPPGMPGKVEENKCKVCMERDIDVVILKCGHMCICLECGKLLAKCPICRCPINELVRVFRC